MLGWITVYPEIKKSIGKDTWLVSHHDDFDSLNKYRVSMEFKGLSFFTITKNLQYKSSAKTEKKISKFCGSYAMNFNNKIRMFKGQTALKEKHMTKGNQLHQGEVHFVLFQEFRQSLFAFVYLDLLGVRTYFAKDSQINGK